MRTKNVVVMCERTARARSKAKKRAQASSEPKRAYQKMFEFKVQYQDAKTAARTGVFTTPHGAINTPVFMPVGTRGTVKTLSPDEVKAVGAEIILANTYHLYLRPGHETIAKMGGLHKWTSWDKPILTDSGGYQVFSLGMKQKTGSERRKISNNIVKIFEDGVEFRSHLDGSKHFLTPQKVIEIQHALGADIIMAFDECAPHDVPHSYAKEAMQRTHLWALECKKTHQKLQKKTSRENAQALFPIIQGTIYEDLRMESAKFCVELDLPGVAIGGLSVGEERATLYHMLEVIQPFLPQNKPRYLMGVGTPRDIFEAIERGIDMFDCCHVTRMSRHGSFYDQHGHHHIKNAAYIADKMPLEKDCVCYSCRHFSKSYIRHLVMEKETLGARLLTIHNMHFLLDLMGKIRSSINNGTFLRLKKQYLAADDS